MPEHPLPLSYSPIITDNFSPPIQSILPPTLLQPLRFPVSSQLEIKPKPANYAIVSSLLQHTLKNECATAKSVYQAELIWRSITLDCNVVGILPTGGGKSMTWLVPAVCYPEQLSIVFIPF